MSFDFFAPAHQIAPRLLGQVLWHSSPEGITSGIVVEVEAYEPDDAASHSFRGIGVRNRAMFGPPATLYVYLSYGIHRCCNIVVGKIGVGAAILIRALHPWQGLTLMHQRRNLSRFEPYWLCKGPGRLCQAMGIDERHNGQTLLSGNLRLRRLKRPYVGTKVIATERIGITKNTTAPWRFYFANNRYVSRRS